MVRVANSVKMFRRWIAMGMKGRSKHLRFADTGQRHRPARRVKRWTWGKRD
jgi:hypothetical protein